MNETIFLLTLRQFLGQRRSILLVLLALVPIALAIIYQISDATDHHDWTANVLLDDIVLTSVLPLSCLILGVSALGSEIDDGTVIYILARPVARGEIIAAKFAASFVTVAALIVPATLVAGLIALDGVSPEGIALGFAAATVFGAAAYCAIFILLSVVVGRPLIAGLIYVFIWEGIAVELFTGTRWISVRQYCLGISDLIATVDERIFEADLDGGAALVLIAGLTAWALVMAARRLRQLELRAAD